MKIDILSDLHLDFYFSIKKEIVKEEVIKFFNPIFLLDRDIGDSLIIAGDIGHYNSQNIKILKIIQEYFYKNIICVLGNHDYYLITENIKGKYKNNSLRRAKELIEKLNEIDGIYCLDGDTVTIQGITFGGSMGWYSNAYLKAYFPMTNIKKDNNLLKSNDYNYIKIPNEYNIYNSEYSKLKKIHKKCDIMISHINPSFLEKHMSSRFNNHKSNAGFSFNGHELMREGSMKYWIFGHTHDEIEFKYEDVKCLCNPFGYPSENNNGDWIELKSIIV